ncbi:MAG: hypothetical protein ABI955_13665, partial [Nitrospirota bacterium]
HHTVVNPTFDQFDADTEDMLIKIYGANHQYVESYKYATVGEAEALVNLPESAQEPSARDVPKKGLQQRRQVLQGILTDLQPLEAQEADLLTGEDREDPPGPSKSGESATYPGMEVVTAFLVGLQCRRCLRELTR